MKTQATTRGSRALTLTELLVIIGMIALSVLWFLPKFVRQQLARQNIHMGPNCVSNLKEIYLAAKIWSGDNNDRFPMQVSVTNDAMMKLISHGSSYVMWQSFSNELSSPKILICPEDKKHVAATNFTVSFSDANISYFLNLDASLDEPQTIVAGDDNLAVNGKPVQPGILSFSTNAVVEWTDERHRRAGNIALSDGSVQQTTTHGLQQAFQQSNFATNQWAIP